MVIECHWQGRTTNQLTIDDGGPSFPFKDGNVIAAANYQPDPSSHHPFILDRSDKLLQNEDIHRYEQSDHATPVVSTGPLGLRARTSKRLFDLVNAGDAVVALSPQRENAVRQSVPGPGPSFAKR